MLQGVGLNRLYTGKLAVTEIFILPDRYMLTLGGISRYLLRTRRTDSVRFP